MTEISIGPVSYSGNVIPLASTVSMRSEGWPEIVTRYVLGTSVEGWARRFASSPSFVRRMSPSESRSSLPTL